MVRYGSKCISCPNGYYTSRSASKSCDMCAITTYADERGLTACKPKTIQSCAEGHYYSKGDIKLDDATCSKVSLYHTTDI